MPRYNARDVLATLTTVGHSVLRRVVPGRNCIEVSRAAGEALRAFGIESQLVTTQFHAINGPLIKALDAGSCVLDDQETWPEGAWLVGTDHSRPTTKDAWPNHLVVVAENLLIDLTVDQFNSTENGLSLPSPAVFEIDEKWLRGEVPAVFHHGDAVLHYKVLPEDSSWKEHPGWTTVEVRVLTANIHLLAQRTAAAMRSALEAAA